MTHHSLCRYNCIARDAMPSPPYIVYYVSNLYPIGTQPCKYATAPLRIWDLGVTRIRKPVDPFWFFCNENFLDNAKSLVC
ncbi:hypothetical protein PGIGA_G00139250 [Pangasianodon gigas]|uniref:Uncharacterized protein n=1 Tax=Pangasianodon gigas TaxID=30993 RepID=A0ACC5XL71_PANGG|nr:hypothetical protein [Pangasianodon gigas]